MVVLVLLAGSGCGGGGSGSAPQPGAPSGKTVTVAASALTVQAGAAVTTVATYLSHNLHQDPNALNAAAGRAALLELNQDYPIIASHDYVPNTVTGTWDFSALDGEIALLTGPGLKGTLAYNPLKCPAYMANGGIDGAAPSDSAKWGQYCQRLVQYYNTSGGFTDGGTTHSRTPVGIRYWELWGEPDINEFFSENGLPEPFPQMTPAQRGMFLSTPALYQAMYEAAVGPMKAADPTIKVGGPGISSIEDTTAQTYITQLLLTSQPLDFVSYHDYAFWDRTATDLEALQESATITALAQQVRQQIAASSHPSAELWITEGNGNPVAYVAPIDRRAQSTFDVAYLSGLVRGYVLAGVNAFERFELMEPVGEVYSAVDAAGTRSPAFYGWKVLVNNLSRGAAIRSATVTDPQPSSGTAQALAIQASANTLTVFVINQTALSTTANSSALASGGGATINVNLSVTDRPVVSATCQLVDGSVLGIQTPPLTVSGGAVQFSMQGYGLACVTFVLN